MTDSTAQAGSTIEARRGGHSRLYPFVILVLILGVVAGIRIRLLSAPLERDEGEYAYGGQLLLQGSPLYLNLYTMKWPGTHAAYAMIMAVFGQTPSGIHAGLLLVNLATSILVFVLGRRMGGNWMGIGAAATQAFLSTNPMLLGLAGHATHFVALAAVAGLCLIVGIDESTSSKRIFFAGVLMGIAALMKQSGAVFGIFAAGWIAWRAWTSQNRKMSYLPRQLGLLGLGGLLPLLVVGLDIQASGGFSAFWLWTVKYARAYAAERGFRDGLGDLASTLRWAFLGSSGFWILACLGVVVCCVQRRWRPFRVFLIALLLCSFAGVCPGWYFRQHYFLLMVPAVSLFAGAALQAAQEWALKVWRPEVAARAIGLGLAGIAAWTCFQSRGIFFQRKPDEVWRSEFTPNLFAEAIPVAEFIRRHSNPGRRIAVLGSEPELFFYSHRLSATGHIYMYPLMEPQPYAAEMQRDMIREIELNRPDYVVLVQDPYSWLRQADSPTQIFEWLDRYGRAHLRLTAWVEKLSSGQTAFHWSAPEGAVRTESTCWLAVYQDIGDPGTPAPTAR